MRDRWEALEPKVQAAVAFPVLGIFTFLLNIGPFAQPLGSSIIYGFIEGGFFTGMLVYASRAEREKRDRGGH